MTPLSGGGAGPSTSSLRYMTPNCDRAGLVAHALDVDMDGVGRQQRQQLVRPLHDRDPVAGEELFEAEVEELGEVLRAVRVDVMHGKAPAILVHEHERRTDGASGDAEPTSQPLREARL